MLFEFFRIGLGVIFAHKFRSVLTIISITIGAFSIVFMASLAASATGTMAREIEEMGGSRMVAFFPKSPERAEAKQASYFGGITLADAAALRGRVPHARFFALHAVLGIRDVRHQGGTATRADLLAANQDFLGAFAVELAAGRGIDAEDLAGQRRIAVLGHGTAAALFGAPRAALGRTIRAGAESFRVVGVAGALRRTEIKFGFDWNDFVLVPLGATPVASGQTSLVLLTEGTERNDLAKRVASTILSDRHRGVDDFQLLDFGTFTEQFYKVFTIMRLIVGIIAGIALVVGGVGIMNILLVSVSERLREIGIRKAIGASDAAIGAQFLFESGLLSALGGGSGAAAGAGATVLAGRFIAADQPLWVSVVAVDAVVGAIVTSALIGIIFGVVPARKASRLAVVDCLRATM